MREKSRTFRCLLLESLEHRTVFAADGFQDVWHVHYRASHTEITYVQDGRAQFSAIIVGSPATIHVSDGDRGHGLGGPKHRPVPDELHAEGEFDSNPRGSSNNLSIQLGDPRKPDLSAQPKPPVVQVEIGGGPAGRGPLDVGVISSNVPRLNQSGLGFSDSVGAGFPTASGSQGNGTQGTAPSTNSPAAGSPSSAGNNDTPSNNLSQPFPNLTLTLTPQSNSTSTSNFAALTSESSQATFDFSLGSNSQNSVAQNSISNSSRLSDSSFRFSASSAKSAGKVFDAELVERSAGIASLETLLSDLAEHHRQSRSEQSYDSNRPNARFDAPRDLTAEAADAVALTFADGGLIALALNREVGSQNLRELADDVNRENRTWIANVGIYREFENAAIVATEAVAAPIRSLRDASASQADLTRAEEEVSDSQLHPLLASSTALVGAMLFSLRRVRKNVRWMYTKR